MTVNDTVFTLFSFLLGLILGSFLNVCIYRIPRRESIVYPSSNCPECGRPIRFYDNIPLLSYMILLGKCRTCGKPIPIRYPLVELVTGLLSMALFMKFGPTAHYPLFLLFCAALLVISFIDLQHQIIPDVISLPGILLGFGFSVFGFTGLSWLDSFIGIVGGGGFLFVVAILFERLARKEGMGGGDVKLLAMMGAWMGWRALPFIILISSFAGTVIGGGSLLISGRSYRTKIPFGPFLALAALIYLFFGTEFVSWYYQLFR